MKECFCGSTDIEEIETGLDIENEIFYQFCACCECGRTWKDYFSLRYSYRDPLSGPDED